MIAQWKRIKAAVLLVMVMMTLLSGCWDNHELDEMFIITGVALDEAEDPEQMDITMQTGKTRTQGSGSGDANSQENSVILLKTTGDTMAGAITGFNRDSSRTLFLHHNQVLLLGSALAEQGVKDRIDLFMRDQQARKEVLVMVADGRAEKVLSTEMEQDKISGMFLLRVMEGLYAVSPQYRVRLLDFASRLLDETTSPIAPIAKVVRKDDRDIIRISGMAVFKEDRMAGRLSNDETMGYILSMGNVKRCDVTVGTDLGKASFRVIKLDCERDVELRQDGGVGVALSIETTLNVSELRGFEGTTPEALMPHLAEVAQEEIRRKITDTFEIMRKLNTDIYGFGTSVYRKYPKAWKTMKDRWDEIFPDIELTVRVRARLSGTGQIVQSLEMEGEIHEN